MGSEQRADLLHKPDPAAFDPITEICWTSPTAAAWIIERSPEGVREHWDKYRRECNVWRRRAMSVDDDIVLGYELQPAGPTSLFRVLRNVQEPPNRPEQRNVQTLSDRRERQSPFDPAGELAFALRSGQLPATGLWSNNEIRSSVSKEYWLAARKGEKPDVIEELSERTDKDKVDSFKYILVNVRDALSIWPVYCSMGRPGPARPSSPGPLALTSASRSGSSARPTRRTPSRAATSASPLS
jgi:hypothetical protein